MIWEGYSKIWQFEKLGDGLGGGGWFFLDIRIGYERANKPDIFI